MNFCGIPCNRRRDPDPTKNCRKISTAMTPDVLSAHKLNR